MGICVSCRRRERKAPEKRTVPGVGRPAKGAAAAVLLPRRADRLPMMANSMTNIKIKNPIKSMVSKHRKRYMKDGFNLDLAYITDRLIAMGFPAEKLEGVYRNHIDEVYRFLEKMHKDHYKIYNLCTERSYDSSKFHERVEKYAFDDHTPPSIDMIQPFCENVHNWLSADQKNVAAVHCKAGKGRTGTMICCYLLYSRQMTTADEALKFYGTERTYDDKGVTIPSQRRYVEYYAWLLNSGLQYAPTKVHIRELVITPPPFQYAGNTMPELQITQLNPAFQAPMGCHEIRRTETSLHVHLTHCTPLCGDVRVNLNNKQKMKRKLFHFWFNTFFVAFGVGAVSHPPLPDSPNLETFKLTLNKWQLDDAHKDDKHKYFSQDFKVELIVQKLPDSSTFTSHGSTSRAPSPPSSTASSCSEPDTEPDGHWDSGERFSYQPLDDDSDEFAAHFGNVASTPVTDCNTALGYVARDCAKVCHCKSAVGDCVTNDGNCKSAVGDYTASALGDCADRVRDRKSAVGDFGTGVGNCKSAVGDFGSADGSDGNKATAVGNATVKPVDECKATVPIGGNAIGKYASAVGDHKAAVVCDNKDPAICRCEGSAVGNSATPTQYKASIVGDYESAVGNYKAAAGDYAIGDYNVTKPSSEYGANKSKGLKGSNAKNGDGKVIQYITDGSRKPLEDFDVSPKKINTGSDYVSDSINARKSRDRGTPTINPLYCSKTDSINSAHTKKVPEFKSNFNPPFFDQNEPMETNDVSSAPASARESPVEENKKRSDDKTKPRLSLPSRGDMRASWREFSGKFASDSRRRKDES